ncbi:MAG: hypothetical protein KAI64_01840, partial [Thermoplasmata archaeon]|nr:hypothetical protein [Thermoplasmata archaeon]
MDLMELAKERKLDASKCRSKADYIKLLSRKEKVPDAPKEERLPEKELKELEMIKKELAETGEEIKKTIEEAKSIPNMVDEEAD